MLLNMNLQQFKTQYKVNLKVLLLIMHLFSLSSTYTYILDLLKTYYVVLRRKAVGKIFLVRTISYLLPFSLAQHNRSSVALNGP